MASARLLACILLTLRCCDNSHEIEADGESFSKTLDVKVKVRSHERRQTPDLRHKRVNQ